MKKIIFSISLVSTLVLITRCSEEKTDNSTSEEKEVITEKPCLLSLNKESVVVNWTAFKLTEKAGVGGSFDSVVVSGATENENIIEAASTISFEIYTSTVNSKNPERDVKISNSFFGTMEATETISGKIISLNENGSGLVLIKMNSIEKEVEVKWEVSEENRFKLSTTINVPDWEAQASLDSLNDVCSLLHTSKDGVSILWPDVEIEVIADFNKACD